MREPKAAALILADAIIDCVDAWRAHNRVGGHYLNGAEVAEAMTRLPEDQCVLACWYVVTNNVALA